MLLLSMIGKGTTSFTTTILSSSLQQQQQYVLLQSSIFPSIHTASKLCITGTIIGPIIDSLHNQCLLTYNYLPIIIDLPNSISAVVSSSVSSSQHQLLYYEPHFFASSWIVPPLLGITYIILGSILPRIIRLVVNTISNVMKNMSSSSSSSTTTTDVLNQQQQPPPKKIQQQQQQPSTFLLGCKAILAILSTAVIIQFSQYLLLHPNDTTTTSTIFESSDIFEQHLIIMLTLVMTQWAYLDGTFISLLSAILTSIVGPLCELPFIANHIWTYLPQANDIYIPFHNFDTSNPILQALLGTEYNTLAINGITGPCYFAVTMDAIAIGKFFDSLPQSTIQPKRRSNQASNDNENDNDTVPTNRLFIAKSSSSSSESDSTTSEQPPPQPITNDDDDNDNDNNNSNTVLQTNE